MYPSNLCGVVELGEHWVSTAEYLQLHVNSEYSGVLENQGTAWQGNLQFPATLSMLTYENTSKLKMSSRDIDVAAPTSQLDRLGISVDVA